MSVSIPLRELREPEPLSVELHRVPTPPAAAALADEQLAWADKMVAAGQFSDAREIYERLSQSTPHSARLEMLIARTYHGEHDSARALEHLEAAISNDPSMPEPRLLLSNIFADTNRLTDARRWCDSIDDAALSTPVLREQYARLLVKVQSYTHAVEFLTATLHDSTAPASMYLYRGLAYNGLSRHADARRDLETFLRLAEADDPERATAEQILSRLR